MKLKQFIGFILIFSAFIGMIICAIDASIFYLQNPDMTKLRRLIEYPAPSIWAVVCLVGGWIGKKMLGEDEEV
jgi:hypothetical protein